MNDIENQINDLTNTSPAQTQQGADNYVESTPDTNATTHSYGVGLEKQDAPILQEEASGENRGIDMSSDANGLVVGTAIPGNKYDTSYVQEGEGSKLLFNPNVYDPMPWPALEPKEKDALAQMAQAYIAVEGNRVPEDYIGYTPLPKEGSLSWWSHLVGEVQNTTMSLPEKTIKAGVGVLSGATNIVTNLLAAPLRIVSDEGSALSNTAFGRWAKGVADRFEDINSASDSLADVVDKALDPIETMTARTYEADLADQSLKANLGRGFGSGLTMLGLGIGLNSPTLAAGIFNMSELNSMRRRALDAGVSPAWARAYATGGAAAMTALDVVEIMGGMGTLTLTYKAGRDYLKSIGKRGTGYYLKKEAGEMLAEAGVEGAQETIEGWYDPEFQENPVDRLFVAGVSAAALRGLGVLPSIRHAKLEDQKTLAEYHGVLPQYNALLAAATSTVDEMVEKGVIDPSKRNEVIASMISEAPDMLIETLRLGAKGNIEAIPEQNRRDFAQTLKAMEANYGKDVFSPQTFAKLDSETELQLSDIRNGLSVSEVNMIKGVVRGAYVMAAMANVNNPNYKGFTIPKFVVAKDADGSSYMTKDGREIGIHQSRSNTENTNISPDYAVMLRGGFMRSSAMSDKMASLLHEMAHWVDKSVGQKGFGDFLEHYYNSISEVFGKDKAFAVYNKTKQGNKRWNNEPVTDYTDESRGSEYFAQAVSRLGKRAAEAFGLGKSQANQFLSYANIMLNQLGNLTGENGEALVSSIADFQTELQRVTKANMDKLSDIIDVYGTDNIKRALKNFTSNDEGFGDFAEYLASKDMLSELFDVMNGFADATGAEKLNDLFDNNKDAMDNFVTMGDKLFRDGYDNAVEEVRQRRKNAATPVEAKPDPDAIATLKGILVSDTVNSNDVNETTDREQEAQDWAKAASAKDSVKDSFKAAQEPKKQITADTKIDGRNLTDDIDMANQSLAQRLKEPMNKLVKWASSSPWGWGLDRILVTLLGRNYAEQLDVAGKYAKKQNIRSGYWDEFMTRLKPLFGADKSNTEFMYNYKTMINNLGFVRMNGLEIVNPTNPLLTSKRDITGWEAAYVYLMKEQGFGDRVQRSTTTNIDDIIATLSKDEKEFALAMSDQLMSMYEKTFGKSKYEHYFPILSAEHELFDELSIDSLTARMNTDDAIAIVDAGRIFSQYVSRWASHESNYFQTMKRVRDIFRYTGVDKSETGPRYEFNPEEDEARIKASAQVAATTRQILGEDGYRNLLNLVNSELQDGQEQMFDASRNKTLTQMGNNIVRSILSNKMVSFPKNLANMFMFWGGAKDQSTYWNSFAEGIGDAKGTYDYMVKNSHEIKQRWGSAGGINEYLDQRTLGGSTAPVMKGIAKVFSKMEWTGDKTQNMAKFSAAMDMLGDAGLKVFMQSGDMIANVYGGYGLIKDYMAQGLTEAEAFKKLDRYIIEHQSSSNLAMKPLVQKLNNKSLLGQVFAFTSEGVAKWASILGTFDEVKMGTATKSEAMANVVSIAISMALYSIVAAGAWDLLDDDEKVQEETVKALGDTMLDQVFGGLVAGNAFITPAISALVGDSRVSGMSVPIYNFALDGISALKKGEYDRVLMKAMSAFGVPIGADNLWNTYLGMSLLNDPNPDVRYAGRLMTAGYTPSRASKRSNVKKENLEKNDEE